MTATLDDSPARTAIARAARRVYDAETAFHAARQSGVDEWIAAAADRLHDALVDYRSERRSLRR